MKKLSMIIISTLVISTCCYAEDITKDAIHLDNKLNASYKNIMSLLASEQKSKLRDAQRLWIKYRDAACDFEAGISKNQHWIEKDVSKSKAIECISRLSAVRTKELNKYIDSLTVKNFTGIITGSSSSMLTQGSRQITHLVNVKLTETNSKITFIFPLNTPVRIGDQILIKRFLPPLAKRAQYTFIKYIE